MRLAEGQVRSDLEWLVELETLTRRRPAGQRKRLTTGEREHLVQLLDTVERLPRSGRTAAASTALPLIILPALGPGLPPGFLETDGMPPVPDKARTGRFFGRRVMEFQNWTLASNARWHLTDEQLALLWQAEFPNSRTRYTMKSVRTVRNLFNLGGCGSSSWTVFAPIHRGLRSQTVPFRVVLRGGRRGRRVHRLPFARAARLNPLGASLDIHQALW